MLGAKIGAYAGVPFMAVISPFGWGLLIWLVGTRILKSEFGYLKAVEVAGLSAVLVALEGIIRSLLILTTGNLWAATSPALFISGFDPQSTLHGALALLNVMTFWILGVRALGLAKLSGSSFAKAAAWVFGLWLAYSGLALAGGAAARAIAGK